MDVPQDPFLPDDNAADFGKGVATLHKALLLGGMDPDTASSVIAKYLLEIMARASESEGT